MLKASEETAGATRELLDGAKVVKFMGWEETYLAHICRRRATELTHLRTYRIAINVVVQIGRASPIISILCTVLVLVLTSPDRFRADVVLPIISLFQVGLAPSPTSSPTPSPHLGHASATPRPGPFPHVLAPRSRRSSRRCACPSSCCRWSSRS